MKIATTQEQLHMLRERRQGHSLEPLITVAIVTGLRRDELRRLTWSDLNLDTDEIRVLDAKTRCGSRQILLPEDVASLLRQHALRQEE